MFRRVPTSTLPTTGLLLTGGSLPLPLRGLTAG